MIPAIVLSAGLGTRLRPLTDGRAKSLVPVGDRPVLAHILDRLRGRSDIGTVVVNAFHHADQVEAFVHTVGGNVRVSREAELLGTAGGIAAAATLLGEGDVLVWNGDILVDPDLPRLILLHDAARAGPEPVVTTLLVEPLAAGQGAVGLDARGDVVRLRGERFGGDEVRGAHYLGVSILGAALRPRLPRVGGLVEDGWMPALARAERIASVPFDRPWADVGTIESYLAANRAWLEGRHLPAWAAPDAVVAPGVALVQSVVGAGAVVEGSGTLERCVVWPGARCTAPLRDQVVVTS